MSDPQRTLQIFDSESRGGGRIGWVAGKRLVAVDLPGHGSNQHEIGGSRPLKAALGIDRISGAPIRWLRLDDAEGIVTDVVGRYSWYDTRENQPHRSPEYRLYYDTDDSDAFLRNAEPGDLVLLLGMSPVSRRALVALVVAPGSTLESQLCWLFGLDPDRLDKFVIPDPSVLAERSKRVESQEIVEALGFVHSDDRPPASDLDLVRRRFGIAFPSTAQMSAFAREQAAADAAADPDEALLVWLEREEALFRALEEYLVIQKLDAGFTDVDDFIGFSLSVQNRRKARMGLALEHHLRAVFDACGVEYSYQSVTENNARPDFLFPSIETYRNPSAPTESLHMLGAKSTCKDRWRQILSEAERIPEKHLCTLEPGISVAQTDEMKAHGVRLVIPTRIVASYAPSQRTWASSLAGFVGVVA
ncbi:MAG: type II restriction endonuclease [Actinomycetota bacterium]